MTREEAVELMHEYTESDSLRKHMYAVEMAMRGYARKVGADVEAWGLAGLLHDFDYEKFPNDALSPTEEHPAHGVRILREKGVDEEICEAIMGHANYSGVPRVSEMAKTLYAVDELCGLLVACALVRPSRSLSDMALKSFKKKFKDKAFAKGVNRDDVREGASELGVDFDEHVQFVMATLAEDEGALGLGLS